jgi:prepilin-type N-terminal cleavage/methylation domain-containing protein
MNEIRMTNDEEPTGHAGFGRVAHHLQSGFRRDAGNCDRDGRAPLGFRISDFLRPSPQGFTLIEMLVVVAIIAILASLIFPVTAAVARARIRSSAKAQMSQMQTAIDEYKTKLGYYPPDNPIPAAGTTNFAVNQLYYELEGTTATNGSSANPTYQTLNGSAQISQSQLPTGFGTTRVGGFMNSAKSAASDDVQNAIDFFKESKAGQSLLVPAYNAAVPIVVFGTTLSGPLMYTDTSGNKINPWRYNSSNPVNNPNSYDLWIDVLIGGKTNRICNWSTQPLILSPAVPGSY